VTENPFYEDDSPENEIIENLTVENNQLKAKVKDLESTVEELREENNQLRLNRQKSSS